MKDRKNLKEGEVIILEDNFPGEHYAYLLGVHTGSRLNSGTNAAVGVRVFGESDDSRPHILRSSHRSVLNAFSEDWFLIYTPRYLGKIRRLWVWHNAEKSGSDWFVDSIDIYDLKTKVEYIFEVNRWIAIEVDANPDIFLAPVKVQEYFSAANVFRENFFNGVKDTHMWTSLCLKHPRNPISRVERVSVIACYVLSAKAVSLLLYFTYFKFDIDEDEPSYYFGNIDILIFVLTLLTASIVVCLVMGLFRRSLTHRYNVVTTPQTFRTSRQGNVSSGQKTLQFSEGDEFTTVRELNVRLHQDINSESAHRFGLHGKPQHLRSTRDNCATALHRIAKGTSLLPLRLPGTKSDLVVRKPWFITAWLLCIFTILSSTTIIVLYAWKLPTVKEEKFLATFLVVVFFDLLIISFLKVLFFSAILSYMFQNVGSGTNYHIRIKAGARLSLYGNTYFLENLLETRKQRSYYPLPESVKELKMQAKIRRHRWRILIEFVMVLALLSVISMICKIYYIDRYMSNSHATRMIATGGSIQKLSMNQVFNRTDYFKFLDYSYVGHLYRFMWYNYEPLIKPTSVRKDWTSDCVSRLLGDTRIRQLRVSLKNCTMTAYNWSSKSLCVHSWAHNEENKDIYSTSWHQAEFEDTLQKSTTWKYTEAKSSNSSRFYGQSGTLYHGGGYIADLGYSRRATKGALLNLEVETWLDHMTRAVFVELTLYNVNTDLFTQVVLVTEQHPTGQFISLPKVDSVTTNIGFDPWNISFIIFQVIFLFKALYYMNRKGTLFYFSSLLNKYEVFLLVLGFSSVVSYAIHVDHSSHYVEEFHRRGLDEFFSFFKIIRYDNWSKAIMCFLFVCVVVKLLLSWKFGQIYISFYYTILLSWSWIIWLTFYFTIWLIILWRYIGYNLNVYIFSYYSIAIIYPKDFKVSGVQSRVIERVVVYLMCILSSFVIIMFIASFTHYYRVGRFVKTSTENNIDSFNYGTFFKTELKRLTKRKEKIEI